jgi:hypothetical protein
MDLTQGNVNLMYRSLNYLKKNTKINSISLSFFRAYKSTMKKTWLPVFIVLLCFAVMALPVSAAIQQSITTNFDAQGKTSAFGEEIASTLVISAGESDIKDLMINFHDADAFIDYNSFKKEINPAGASVNITPTANGFSIDSLPKGVVVTITFNAYPKTIQPDVLHVADIGFSYTQLGQRFEPSTATPALPVSVDLKSSAYHTYENTRGEIERNSIGLYIGAIMALAAIIAFAIMFIKRREYTQEIVRTQEKKNQLLGEIYHKVELAENNAAEYDSLKKKLRDEMGSGSTMIKTVSENNDAKKPPRDTTGGFE